jgi:hypothetical protein
MHRVRALTRSIAAVLMVAGAVWSQAAAAAELLMYRRAGCPWCLPWDREIGTIYSRTEIGRRIPVRMVHMEGARPAVALKGPVMYTPTFVLIDRGREVGNFSGPCWRGWPGDCLECAAVI